MKYGQLIETIESDDYLINKIDRIYANIEIKDYEKAVAEYENLTEFEHNFNITFKVSIFFDDKLIETEEVEYSSGKSEMYQILFNGFDIYEDIADEIQDIELGEKSEKILNTLKGE